MKGGGTTIVRKMLEPAIIDHSDGERCQLRKKKLPNPDQEGGGGHGRQKKAPIVFIFSLRWRVTRALQ